MTSAHAPRIRPVCNFLALSSAALLVLLLAPVARSATLTITVRGLPKGIKPAVTVTGPHGFNRRVHKIGSVKFGHVANGRYRVRAPKITFTKTTSAGSIAGESAIARPSWETLCRTDGRDGHGFSITIKRTSRCQLSGRMYIGYRAGPTSGGPHFAQLAASTGRTCGLRLNGIVTCWGGPPKSYIVANEGPPAGRFVQIALHESDGPECGLRPNGALACWNITRIPQLRGPFTRIAVGDGAGGVCGITPARNIKCSGVTAAPPGQFVDVAVSDHAACGVALDGSVKCAGSASNGPALSPPGQFVQVVGSSLGNFTGLHTNGVTTDWNSAERPDRGAMIFEAVGPFIRLGSPSCGLRPDRSVACGTKVRPGPYLQIAASANHACALRTDATAECWFLGKPRARDNMGQTRVPTK